MRGFLIRLVLVFPLARQLVCQRVHRAIRRRVVDIVVRILKPLAAVGCHAQKFGKPLVIQLSFETVAVIYERFGERRRKKHRRTAPWVKSVVKISAVPDKRVAPGPTHHELRRLKIFRVARFVVHKGKRIYCVAYSAVNMRAGRAKDPAFEVRLAVILQLKRYKPVAPAFE